VELPGNELTPMFQRPGPRGPSGPGTVLSAPSCPAMLLVTVWRTARLNGVPSAR